MLDTVGIDGAIIGLRNTAAAAIAATTTTIARTIATPSLVASTTAIAMATALLIGRLTKLFVAIMLELHLLREAHGCPFLTRKTISNLDLILNAHF